MATIGVDRGVTPTGFIAPTLVELKTEVESDWLSEFGANTDLDPNQPDGQLIGIFTDRVAELWEMAQGVYSAQDPDKAGGQAQDALCAVTGSVRDPASRSTVTLTATGTAGTVLAIGREASVSVTGDRFRTLAGVTLAAGTARAPTTAYASGVRRTNDARTWLVITSGTTSGGAGPTGTGQDVTDGTVHWRYLGDGLANIDVAAEAVETGPRAAVSGSLSTIETPVSGWSNVVNILDAVPGEDEESNDALRVKREAELAAAGSSTAPAIRAAVLKVTGVTSCVVFQNTTLLTDVDGRPGKSVEAVVEGGVDVDVAAAIFARVAAGIQPYGTTVDTVTDSQGLNWSVGFSRPTQLTIYVRVDVVKDPLTYPVDGDAQIKAAIVADQANYPIGKDVTSSRVSSKCFQVPGVLDVSLTYIRTSSPAIASTTIPVGPRERAIFDTSRITCNTSNGIP